MCLNLRAFNSNTPYNDSKIRYKVLQIDQQQKLCSAFIESHTWIPGEWYTGEGKYDYEGHDISFDTIDHGFHVFVSLESAEKSAQFFLTPQNGKSYVIARLEVDEFIASGTFAYTHSETWKRAKLLDIIK